MGGGGRERGDRIGGEGHRKGLQIDVSVFGGCVMLEREAVLVDCGLAGGRPVSVGVGKGSMFGLCWCLWW